MMKDIQTTELAPARSYKNQAFDLATSFYKLFDIDPYKWVALYQGQVNMIENALRDAYEKGKNAG